jgi:excinuclease ABC subunit C
MKGLFQHPTFTGFGPCRLWTAAELPAVFAVRGARPSRLRARVRQHAPRLPGVYGMIDVRGDLIYIGKAKSLRSRLMSYFRPNSRDPKAGRILEHTRVIAWESGPDEFAALLRELELIRRWRPRFNVQGQPRRNRRGYVCVGRKPAPYVFFAARPPATASAVFGPVPAGRTAREAVRRVNDWFRLRDCPQSQEMVFADQQELFPVLLAPGCLRHDIGNCLGPCAAACSRADYAGYVRAAVAFLEGKDSSPLETLERDMTAASAALQYERAAALRDRLDPLRWLSDHLRRVREAARPSFVYPVGEVWYLIHGGTVRAALPVPRDDAGRRAAAAVLQDVYSKEIPAGPPTLEEIDGVLLVASWFRRHAAERQRTLESAAALLSAPGSGLVAPGP